tara:strand:+ start:49 stop:609 length:561 start_codon:yes stop_codon:yes gene_type:complete
MSLIHSSHPRKDLIEIMKLFEFKIPDYENKNKKQMANALWNIISQTKVIVPDDEYYFVSDIYELKNYLMNESPRQVFPVKIQDKIYEKTRNLIFYCRDCGYNLEKSLYSKDGDILDDADLISCWGDNPSVRRAIRLLNKDPRFRDWDLPVANISCKMEKRLQRKERLRVEEQRLKVNKGNFLVIFD